MSLVHQGKHSLFSIIPDILLALTISLILMTITPTKENGIITFPAGQTMFSVAEIIDNK